MSSGVASDAVYCSRHLAPSLSWTGGVQASSSVLAALLSLGLFTGRSVRWHLAQCSLQLESRHPASCLWHWKSSYLVLPFASLAFWLLCCFSRGLRLYDLRVIGRCTVFASSSLFIAADDQASSLSSKTRYLFLISSFLRPLHLDYCAVAPFCPGIQLAARSSWSLGIQLRVSHTWSLGIWPRTLL